MGWDAISALAELAGAIAVVATLLYLAAQIRQNTTAVRGATFQSITDAATSFSDAMGRDPEGARVFSRGRNLDSLSEEESRRFQSLMLSLVRRSENLEYQTRKGLLDESDWAGLRASIVEALATPGARRWCAENVEFINPHFRAFLAKHCGPAENPHTPAESARSVTG
ncbi:MAG: hypothetical protein FJ091_08800 [Deltaproteobacteria bacterium]|nr:hypothetical protein [Deltaproteobacteria bacterium]